MQECIYGTCKKCYRENIVINVHDQMCMDCYRESCKEKEDFTETDKEQEE